MTLEEAKGVLRTRVYESTRFLEELGGAHKLKSDAFLARKRIADQAVTELENLWEG